MAITSCSYVSILYSVPLTSSCRQVTFHTLRGPPFLYHSFTTWPAPLSATQRGLPPQPHPRDAASRGSSRPSADQRIPRSTSLKIMVSPVRIRVPPLIKVLQMAEKQGSFGGVSGAFCQWRVNSRIEKCSLLGRLSRNPAGLQLRGCRWRGSFLCRSDLDRRN